MVKEVVKGLEMGIPLLAVILLGILGIANSQNGATNATTTTTTLQPSPTAVPTTPVPTPLVPTPAPTDAPIVPPSPATSSSSSAPGQITCCYVQTACNNCSETYKVNSIVYCCPNCRGMVLVTDLLCRCTVPKGYQAPDLKCKLTNTVVGDYPALRPSYYDMNAGSVLGSHPLLVGILAALYASAQILLL